MRWGIKLFSQLYFNLIHMSFRVNLGLLSAIALLLLTVVVWCTPALQPKIVAQIKRNIVLEQQLFAGTSKTIITPLQEMEVSKGKKIHDDLYSKALILDNGETKIALIVVDNQGVPTWIINSAKQKIQEETDIPISNIMISSTHTHSGVYAGEPIESKTHGAQLNQYQKYLVERIVLGVKNATKNMQVAEIGWGKFEAPEHVHNRRWFVKNKVFNPFGIEEKVKTNPGFEHPENLIEPAGPIDPEVSFFAVRSVKDEPLAVFANYSLHYVGAFSNQFSADYFGLFGEKVGKLLGADSVKNSYIGIMSNGTSGDVSNQNFSVANPKANLYERQELVATDLANRLVVEYNKIQFQKWVPISSISDDLSLDIRKVSPEILESEKSISQKKKNLQTQTAKSAGIAKETKPKAYVVHPDEDKYSKRIGAFERQFPSQVSVPMQAIRIGDLGIGAIPFEVFAETGLDIKSKNPFGDVYFTIGLANGHWGYLPPPNQLKHGGYETWFTVNRVEENASEIVKEKLLTMLRSLK